MSLIRALRGCRIGQAAALLPPPRPSPSSASSMKPPPQGLPKRPRSPPPASGPGPKRARTTFTAAGPEIVDLTGGGRPSGRPPAVVDTPPVAARPPPPKKKDAPAPPKATKDPAVAAKDVPLAEAGSTGRSRTLATLARELRVAAGSVRAAVDLLDQGNTVPFIARYRKEATGSLDDAQLRTLSSRLESLDALEERRSAIVASLESQGVHKGQLASAIREAATAQRLEDLYLPYRPKRTTRASAAKDRGLGPLADLLVCPTSGAPPEVLARPFVGGKDVPDVAAALAGARDIVAEQATEIAEVREHARRLLQQRGAMVSKRAPAPKAAAAKKGKEAAKGGGGSGHSHKDADPLTYQQYFDFRCPVSRLQHHQVLAINRGESNGALSVSLEWDVAAATAAAEHQLLRARGPRDGRPLPRGSADQVSEAVKDGVKRLLKPAVEREARSAATEAAAEHAVRAFGVNLRSLLLQPPLRGSTILGVDPAYRTGCKLAAIDPTGAVLETKTVYPHPPARQDQQGAAKGELRAMLERHGVAAVAIGNGTASRETEQFVAAVVELVNKAGRGAAGGGLGFSVVNEAGASVYSASELASKELPGMDVSLRGAVSIARRLQDPLAELVKIEPRHIGVGLYQHSLQGKRLTGELDGVVETAVNDVGVELNTGSPALLAHVAGLKQSIANNIVAHRTEKGAFTSRAALLKVKGLGARTFEQCAGFLRVSDAPNALDTTGVHPESYPAAAAAAAKLLPPGKASKPSGKLTPAQLEALRPQLEKLAKSEEGYKKWVAETAREAGVGEPTMRDIVAALAHPGRDIRGSAAEGALRTGVGSVDDVKEGMEFTGTVRNVVAFGAFVDIGVGKDALLHVSALRGKGATPADVLSVGQVVQVRVNGLDKSRGRIGITLANGA